MIPRVIEYDEVDSTNEAAKRLVRERVPAASLKDSGVLPGGEVYGTVITAKKQTAGKGRRGKTFFSPGGDSIYASFILPPPENMAEQQITTLTGAAVCEVIEKSTLYKPSIKGINDVMINGRKVCGILTEGIPAAVIIGIGININLREKDFPEELREIAGSLLLDSDERTRLLKALTEAILNLIFEP